VPLGQRQMAGDQIGVKRPCIIALLRLCGVPRW
jgi:hypothetical protein